MKALDTNVLIRFLVADDPSQATKVKDLFTAAEENRESFFVSIPVVLGMLWVLTAVYDVPRSDALAALGQLTKLPFLRFESDKRVLELIALGQATSADLADLLIGLTARDNACAATITLDRKSARISLFELL